MRLITIAQFCEAHPAYTPSKLYKWNRLRQELGLSNVFKKNRYSKNISVDEVALLKWIDKENGLNNEDDTKYTMVGQKYNGHYCPHCRRKCNC